MEAIWVMAGYGVLPCGTFVFSTFFQVGLLTVLTSNGLPTFQQWRTWLEAFFLNSLRRGLQRRARPGFTPGSLFKLDYKHLKQDRGNTKV